MDRIIDLKVRTKLQNWQKKTVEDNYCGLGKKNLDMIPKAQKKKTQKDHKRKTTTTNSIKIKMSTPQDIMLKMKRLATDLEKMLTE